MENVGFQDISLNQLSLAEMHSTISGPRKGPGIVGDFDHNGVSDVTWFNSSTGHIDNWLLAYSQVVAAPVVSFERPR